MSQNVNSGITKDSLFICAVLAFNFSATSFKFAAVVFGCNKNTESSTSVVSCFDCYECFTDLTSLLVG